MRLDEVNTQGGIQKPFELERGKLAETANQAFDLSLSGGVPASARRPMDGNGAGEGPSVLSRTPVRVLFWWVFLGAFLVAC